MLFAYTSAFPYLACRPECTVWPYDESNLLGVTVWPDVIFHGEGSRVTVCFASGQNSACAKLYPGTAYHDTGEWRM